MIRTTLANATISHTRRWPTWARYAAAAAIVAAAFLLRRAADPILPQGYPYLLAFVAVLLSAALFDHATGLLATGLSAALAAYFYLPPVGSLAVQNQGDIVGLGLFGAVGAVISLIVETLHRALADRQRALDDLARSNVELRRSEERRGLLLREFRHRTRNDLHSLVGLLRLRARAAPSDAAREGLREAAEHAMALARVHTHLAGTDGAGGADEEAAVVNTRRFIEGLCADIIAAQMGDGLRPVALVTEAEAHTLDTERAVQLGLVVNEAVTNALKYAFPEDRAGTVRVCFAREAEEFVLTVADDGIGLPAEGELLGAPPGTPPHGSGLGTRLLRALAAQLRGTFSRHPGECGRGTVAGLRFRAAPPGSPH
ncbi:DUF4118 domain-containing protein [Belnapia moabensis]|uniref:DUF4118 domain-containing protein n=1 Tax=Belnapia moabensis TaxID=365533 RepID=UPI0006948E2C|nr:DUF4118 domain-containing protein [Belnapia moabensis]